MEQVLKYKFWILSGLVLPLALTGFFMANGAMQAATQERITQIQGIQPPNPNQPNHTATEVARKQADLLERANAEQLQRLDRIQRAWMTWPEVIEAGLERKPETGEIIYRADTLKVDYRLQFPDEYEKEMRALWLKLNPVIPSGLPYKSRNLVFVDPQTIPKHPFRAGRTPTTQQIWDAQEDYWILSMLVEAINRTNAVAQYNVSDAAIREISVIELFGGSGESSVLSGGTDSQSTDGGGSYSPTGDPSGGTGAGLSITFADGAYGFDPAEEYGSPVSSEASQDQSGSGYGGVSVAAPPLRYIGFDESNPGPFRRRGFYLSVLILERKIPDLVTNLANLDPPILCGRWGLGNNPYDQDHLLKASAHAGGGLDVGSGSGGYGSPTAARRPTRKSSGADPYGASESGVSNMPGGLPARDPRDPLAIMTPAMQAEVNELKVALLGKDLVQLDLTGVVTIFTPEVPPPPMEETSEAQPAAEEPAAAPTPQTPATPEATPEAVPPAANAPESSAPSATPEPAPEPRPNSGTVPPAEEPAGATPGEPAAATPNNPQP